MNAKRIGLGMDYGLGLRGRLLAALFVLCGVTAAPLRSASACGCFVPPNFSVPAVQAGEEILFVVDKGRIEMHIKITYQGPASEFGWLLPLPAVPTASDGMPGFEVGSDELFYELEQRTQPNYKLNVSQAHCFKPNVSSGCSSSLGGSAAVSLPSDPKITTVNVVVNQGLTGPYKFAILRADDKSAMLQWLMDNAYAVPGGTEDAVAPYIRPGAYFLALKLQAGAKVGDLQPIVLSYPGDLPMIPLQLTAVGATPNMGILVWVLGGARAIPRNYAHVVLGDAKLDWQGGGVNYKELVTQAVGEAPGKHAFVTEFAGSSRLMANVLDPPGRYSVVASAAKLTDPVEFLERVLPVENAKSPIVAGFAPTSQLLGILSSYIPMPAQLVTEGVTAAEYYLNARAFLQSDRSVRPEVYAGIAAKLAAFDPAALAAELTTRIVTPTLRVSSLFHDGGPPRLTRLYTTLSPADMNSDPVFGWNAELPEVANTHGGDVITSCAGSVDVSTEQGFQIHYSAGAGPRGSRLPAPASLRIELLRDSGPPEVLVDNTEAIKEALTNAGSPQGCAAAEPEGHSTAAPQLSACALLLFALLRTLRRRRATPFVR